jgi:hypothetical protein
MPTGARSRAMARARACVRMCVWMCACGWAGFACGQAYMHDALRACSTRMRKYHRARWNDSCVFNACARARAEGQARMRMRPCRYAHAHASERVTRKELHKRMHNGMHACLRPGIHGRTLPIEETHAWAHARMGISACTCTCAISFWRTCPCMCQYACV